MKKIKIIILLVFLFIKISYSSDFILIPMDESQNEPLKAYGLAYWIISEKCPVQKLQWLLNYKCGSFLCEYNESVILKAKIMNVSYKLINKNDYNKIKIIIEENNMSNVTLEKAPKIAVYVPPNNNPWDDAVTLALTYAEIPFDKLWDDKILKGALEKYDWLHSHHEDFSGQYSKFYKTYNSAPWYIEKVNLYTKFAKKAGYNSVREEKLAVAEKIKQFIVNGGFFFSMCTATESLDVALAMKGTDFISPEIDGTPYDHNYMKKINYKNCLMFKDFNVYTDPYYSRMSNIDPIKTNTKSRLKEPPFELFDFSAKFDQVPTILTQNHQKIIKGFYGLTTDFSVPKLKKDVTILGKCIGLNAAKYIHRNLGKGTITYFGGHDPEDYIHYIGDKPTDLSIKKKSAGYRLILNNILFPAAKIKKLKT